MQGAVGTTVGGGRVGRVSDLESFRLWAAQRLAGLAYVGPDPHHALGLPGLIPGFTALSSRAPALATLERAGARTVLVESTDGSDAAALLETAEVAAYLGGRRAPCPVFVFKPSHRIGELARARGWRLVAPPPAVARRWENKVVFSGLATKLGLRVPEFRVVGSRAEAAEALAALAGDVVVQSPHGYAGARTVRVSTVDELESAMSALRSPQLRLARAIAGIPWTVNACITAHGTAVSAPTLQLTGVPSLTPRLLGACGNDGTVVCAAMPAMRDAARRLGSALALDGYRGLFGVDFVVDDAGPWVIEVNPRLVSSIGLATQAQVAAERVPLVGRHFMALLDPEADGLDLDDDVEPLGASQVVLHNLERRALTVQGDLAAGAMTIVRSKAASVRPVAGLAEIQHEGRDGRAQGGEAAGASRAEWLLLPAGKGRMRAPGAEVARLQRWGPVADAAGAIDPAAEEAARVTYAALRLGPP
jgi:hypothetical protein